MSIFLLQPSFLMSKTRSYAQILIGSWLFLTAMAIHLSLWVAPLDLQQGGNSRILYVHVPVARMSILRKLRDRGFVKSSKMLMGPFPFAF